MTCAGESNQEASAPTNLLSIKVNTRIGTWNIRTLYEVGKAAQVAKGLQEATKAMIAWEPLTPRLMSARFNSKRRKITIIQCYAPLNAAEEQEKDEFYAALQSMIHRAPRRDIKVVMGDLNVKVGEDNTNK
ncbi:craniofacial development protein 2-like [Magallana gigas]|uniref:craniofacial development protein 2-like n=1 Tax=Magallana gigas TaxID=29159 RepID=UPI00333ED34D